jgi:hypothetical protein
MVSTSLQLQWIGQDSKSYYPHSVSQTLSYRLDMLAPLNPARDLRLSGQVIYTGRSSMEVAVKMETIGMNQPEETVLLGRMFCMHKIHPGDFEYTCRPVFYGV